MKPVYQTIFGVPNGNCFSACVASIFEIDLSDVPNYADKDRWFAEWNAWLKPFNLHMICFELQHGSLPWATSWSIGGVPSPTPNVDYLHAVVFEGEELRHDPLPVNSPFKYRKVRDQILFFPLDPARPSMIPRSGQYADQHREDAVRDAGAGEPKEAE